VSLHFRSFFFFSSTNPSSLNIKRKKLSRDWGINKVLALHIRIIATFRQTTKRRNKKKEEEKGDKRRMASTDDQQGANRSRLPPEKEKR
jgi:hypothetical protein